MMTRQSKFLVFGVLALSALGVGALAPGFADEDDWRWGHGMMGKWFMGEMMNHGMMEGWGPGMMMGKRFTSERLDALKSELKITDAQAKPWDDYVKALQAAREGMREAHMKMMQAEFPKKLPERMAMHRAMMSARMTSMKSVDDATLALYNALSDEQKAKADDLIAGMGMMGMMGMM
jgi:hypothetical protein